jgi:hypothetical protein
LALYQNKIQGNIPLDILKLPKLQSLVISGNTIDNLAAIKAKAKFQVE